MKLILVSNRLPVRVTQGPDGPVVTRGDGGLATAVGRAARRLKPRWVGCLGAEFSADDFEAMSKQGFLPLALPDALYKRYYAGYSNQVLWPVLHGFKAILSPKTYWADYVRANNAFADQIAGMAGPDDVIWIHDYHLFLLPELLRARGLKNKIGFFLHTPFPNTAYFRDTAPGRRIIRSLELCDSVGVQTSDNLRNLKAIAKSAVAGVFPIGIDYRQFARRLTPDPGFLERIPAKKRIPTILSLSRLDYTKGLPQLLDAIAILAQDESLRQKFKVRLVVVPSREQQPEYQYLRQRIEESVTQINASLPEGSPPLVDLHYGFLSPDECMASYRNARIFVAAPVADGMNLVAKEYIAANPSGTLVLGRAAGAPRS